LEVEYFLKEILNYQTLRSFSEGMRRENLLFIVVRRRTKGLVNP